MVPATVNVCLHGAVGATSLASHHSPLRARRYSNFDVENFWQTAYDEDGVEERSAVVSLVVFAPIIHLYAIVVVRFDEFDCLAHLGSLLGQVDKARFLFHITTFLYWKEFAVHAHVPGNASAKDQVARSFEVRFRHTELHLGFLPSRRKLRLPLEPAV